MTSLLWLRRDLRIEDNISLYFASQEKEAIQPIFIFDENILSRFKNPNDKRISFITDSLIKIDNELRKENSELLVFYGKPEEIIPKIALSLNVKKIFAGQDYEPYGVKRDKDISKHVKLILNNDHLLLTPDRILKEDGSNYRVFTPYFRKWLETINPLDYGAYNIKAPYNFANTNNLRTILANSGIIPIRLESSSTKSNFKPEDCNKRLNFFINSLLPDYNHQRDLLGCDGTSAISPYLRFGNLSVRQCYREAIKNNSNSRWINELAWRDFYAMILYYYPDSINLEMQHQYRNLKWNSNPELFNKFTSGETGFPVVDAAVKQLTTTGWMHNRARMIVASFMTKNLWLDWRLGEEFFAQYLMDYELSSNVGGWQWCASTGTDAQPYFRIFNPYSQSQKFDPNGNYIRKYLPELLNLSNKEIHCPSDLFRPRGYPRPIVDYALTRKQAIENFKSHSTVTDLAKFLG
ncbi:MAG: deoxyribodipyrimidine photo-lyase [Rickettsiales bacterium]